MHALRCRETLHRQGPDGNMAGLHITSALTLRPTIKTPLVSATLYR